MRITRTVLLTMLALTAFIALFSCKKTENTTPRYNKEACLLCSPTPVPGAVAHKVTPGKCSYCGATGVCDFCKGKGKRWVGKGAASYEETCAFCQGIGKCAYCAGSGTCHLCKGTAKYVPFPRGESPAAPPKVQ